MIKLTRISQQEEPSFLNQNVELVTKPNKIFIGPPMIGIYKKRSPEWVMNMIMNPDEMLKKDPVAKALLKKYNNTMMLNQNISEEEARAIAEWFRTLN